MNNKFNNLTFAEAERLALLLEELGEAQQAIGKILRHGYNSYHPERNEQSNRMDLQDELGDVLCAIRMMADSGDIHLANLETKAAAKKASVRQYMHHQTD